MANSTSRGSFWASVVLFLCAALLAYQVFNLRRTLSGWDRHGDPRLVRELMRQEFQTDTASKLSLGTVKSKYILLYLFTPQDCSDCLEELSSINTIASTENNIAVFGVAVRSDRDEAIQTRRNFNLSFPLVVDPSGESVRLLNLGRTPWKIVLRVSDGHAIYEDLPAYTGAQRQAFVERIALLSTPSPTR